MWSKRAYFNLFFPGGTYLFSANQNAHGIRFTGESNDLSIIKSSLTNGLLGINLQEAENIAFENIAIGSYTQSTTGKALSYFNNCKFKWDAAYTTGSPYLIDLDSVDNVVTGCEFNFLGSVYIPLRFAGYTSVLCERNVFNPTGSGYASHNIRFDAPATTKSNVVVRHNLVIGGTTGIFFGSTRNIPVSNCLVELNECRNQTEESISFDGFGNNAGLCPVICNGLITAASNDVNGRLVITAAMKYYDGATPNSTSTVSLRSDWTNFMFSLDEGSGREGTTTKIIAAAGTNDFTLDCYTPAASINVGGWCGVHSGFFDCVVRNNVITGSVGGGRNYATALSIYLNVFNFTIEGNTISGCAHGINVAGGLMLSTYRSRAYNNVVKNNKFLNCEQVAGGEGVVRFTSYYGTDIRQYGNQFINNVVQGGNSILWQQQLNCLFEGNHINVASINRLYCANTLPTANSSQAGRTFMKITDDGAGSPTTIDYYVCKLAGGVYSWVAC